MNAADYYGLDELKSSCFGFIEVWQGDLPATNQPSLWTPCALFLPPQIDIFSTSVQRFSIRG